MKNTTFLLTLFIITYSLSAINPVFCQNNEQISKYSFSLGTGFGILSGEALELVYPVQGETKGELLSELTWDMKPTCYVGFNADFGLTDLLSSPGFFSSLSLKAGIPGHSGSMEDRDWMSIENSALTHFSSHENETNELIWIDLAVGASFPIKFLYIKPFVSGSWMRFTFTGRDGYGIRAREKGYNTFYPIDDNPEKYDFSGRKCITYQQDWLLLAAGLSIGTKIFYPFSFDLSFQISPLTYCAATDNHFYPNGVDYMVFKDFTSLGLFLEPEVSISLDVKKIKFLLETSYRYISKTEGESYTGYNNSKVFTLSTNKAGAGLSVMDFQFIIKLTF